MKKTFKGWLFNRIEIMGNKKFNHIGCAGKNGQFGNFLAQFVPEIGMKRKVRFTIEALEKPKKVSEYKKQKSYV